MLSFFSSSFSLSLFSLSFSLPLPSLFIFFTMKCLCSRCVCRVCAGPGGSHIRLPTRRSLVLASSFQWTRRTINLQSQTTDDHEPKTQTDRTSNPVIQTQGPPATSPEVSRAFFGPALSAPFALRAFSLCFGRGDNGARRRRRARGGAGGARAGARGAAVVGLDAARGGGQRRYVRVA